VSSIIQSSFIANTWPSSKLVTWNRIANIWQRLDENFLDFFQCEAVIEPGPHVDSEFMGLTHRNHDGHRNQAAGAPFEAGTSPDIRKDLVDRVGSDRGTEGVSVSGSAEFCGRLVAHHFADYIDSGFSIRHD
jgi:hypothetical protein